MTPIQAAKDQCANCQTHETCLGVGIDDRGRNFRFRTAGQKCLLADPVQRCAYFDECVLPMSVSGWTPLKQKAWAAALHEYRMKTGASAKRLCPQCRKRGVEAGMKLCVECRKANRKETKRSSQRNSRMKDSSLISELNNQPLVGPVLEGGYVGSGHPQNGPELSFKTASLTP